MGTATNSLPVIALETKHLTLKRIGWLYPIFRDLHFYHGPLAAFLTSGRREWKQMPAVRDVGERLVAPACRHTVRWALYTNCDAIHGRRAFRLVHRGRGQKCGLGAILFT